MTNTKICFLDNRVHQKMGVKVYLDNHYLGKIYTNEVVEINVLPGNHEIYAKFLFVKTNKIKFKVNKENRSFEISNVPITKSFINDTVVKHQTPISLRQRLA